MRTPARYASYLAIAAFVVPHVAWSAPPTAARAEPVSLDDPDPKAASPASGPKVSPSASGSQASGSDATPPTTGSDAQTSSIPDGPLEQDEASWRPPATYTPSLPPEPTPDPGASQRIVGIEIAAVGVAGVVVGTIFGLSAKSKLDDSNAGNCTPGDVCSARGLGLRQDATDAATVSTIAFVAGGIALAGGVVIALTAPRAPKPISLAVTPTLAGATATLAAHF